MKMISISVKCNPLVVRCCAAAIMLWFVAVSPAQQSASAKASAQQPKAADASKSSPKTARTFNSPQEAADALVKAAEDYDQTALAQIFGPDGDDIVFTGEVVQDKQHAANFARAAREKMNVTVDPKTGNRAFLLVGNEDWPFPVPLVKSNQKWFFDSKAGRQELLF